MPWNFPFWQTIRFLIPTLLAGNTALLKPAPSTPQCGIEIVKLFETIGLPEQLVQLALLSTEQVAKLIEDRRVHGVSLTGSTAAGQQVGALAGRALKPTVLELGGSDPFIVLDDADLEAAAAAGVASRFQNTGQSCIAAKRFLVHQRVFTQFLDCFCKELATSHQIGPPALETTTLGPLARKDLKEGFEKQIRQIFTQQDAVKHFELAAPKESDGYYVPARIIEVKAGTLNDFELFGPAALLMQVKDDEEALFQANNSRFGLAATIWGRDIKRLEMLANKVKAGVVFTNNIVRSDPRVPFGGLGWSGSGKELGIEGIRQFTTLKVLDSRTSSA